MTTTPSVPSTPISAVVAYAGPITSTVQTSLSAIGWLPCDGTLYATSGAYAALYGAIQSLDGANGTSQFAVPDYRGAFLRGVDAGSGHDRDAATRGQPRTGLGNNGATGDSPGSLQAGSVAAHSHGYSLNPTYGVMKLLSDDIYENTTQTSTIGPVQGGGNEVRPINIYVNYLICYDNGADFAMPVGAVIPFAGSIDASALAAQGNWMLCDGSQLSTNQYTDLFAVIGQAYGGTATGFCLPDLRGTFLRGTDNGLGRDPDTARRTAPEPGMQNPGNTGDNVGSIQGYSLDQHTHQVSAYNTVDGDHQTQNGTAGPIASTTQSSSWATGGAGVAGGETRPANVSVYWLIKYA